MAKTVSDRGEARIAARQRAHERGLYPAPATEGRGANMQAIRRRNTKPEQALASALHRAGYRFRRDYPIKVDGVTIRPDIVFTRKKIAIFVDGCFWHSCPEHGRRPKVNDWYWGPKLARIRDRDQVSRALLDGDGWLVIPIWEHQCHKPTDALAMIMLDQLL